MKFALKAQDISNQATSLVNFHKRFYDFFQTRTRSMASTALDYLKGLLTVDTERTMAEMERKVDLVNKQQLGHFISNSPWNDESLIEEIQRSVVSTINPEGQEDAAIIIDESAMKKQGHASVGVKRQYCGSLGKIESCQVGVFLAYATSTQTCLIGRSLYLPKDWCEDVNRCDDADIPLKKRDFKTKAQLALELVDQAIKNQIPFKFVHMDAHYGEQPWLLDAIQDRNLTYVADIAKDTRVFVGIPTANLEELGADRFRMSIEGAGAIAVKDLVVQGKIEFRRVSIRDTQRGKLIINFAAIRVRRSQNNIPLPGECWLLVRQELDGSETKFSLSNASETMAILVLAEWQSRRYWVERSLQDAKGLAGLDQYRVTGWQGWHHHTAMVMLAVLYLLTTKATLAGLATKLTLKDALEIMKVVMPQKQLTCEDAVEILREKHENRERSRLSRLKDQEALFADCLMTAGCEED
jgi:SRSO17 transposase